MKKQPMPKRSPVKKKKNEYKQLPSASSFYIVGLGASAGGLDALDSFFGNMAENSGMAFVVVSHLDPTHISIMPELLQKSTKMKVYKAEDGMVVEPDRVYVAPANYNIALLHGTIQLIEPLEAHGFRLPIDYFFKSLSEDVGERAVGIILSGMASDGTAGLKAVKDKLGLVMVQEPSSAKFDGMPSSAIKTGLADYILPPNKMPNMLIKYLSQKAKGIFSAQAITDGKIPDAIQKLYILLRNKTGHDFSMYKQNSIYRRVQRRMVLSQLDTISDYVRMVQGNPDELDSLFRELLIGVTNFFRDAESFVKMKEILLELVKSKPENSQIRIWIAGCSTGEEAYSIAIVLQECMNETQKHFNVQIFATDIDSVAIDKARSGIFSGIASDVGKERLRHFFTSKGNLFHIRKEIRDMVVFAVQSVIKDPPFTKLDLITCRNLLIYFNAELQKKVIPIFHYSLLPKGLLFLGSSETIGMFVDLFSPIVAKSRIYKRRESIYSAQPFLEFPISLSTGKTNETPMKQHVPVNISQVGEKIILQSYSPNCVIITERGEIVYLHGRTGRYLELAHGEAKMNIFEMAREGLRQELPGMIRKALSSKKSLTAERIKVKSNGSSQLINLTVKPIKEPAEMAGFLLIVFEEVLPQSKAPASKRHHFEKKSEIFIKELEHELKSTKENLRSTVEELETSNEELKSSNEEMQSTNEEMQSANEELETSKEEMQSLNEELITVNTELQNKNDELTVVNNDMKNLLDSTDIPTIFLDSNLCIKRFTFHATKVVNLIASDVGRPISHLAIKFKYDNLVEDAKEVLRTLAFKQVELQTNDGLWYQMRIIPYRTISNVIDGVVITFSDINKLKMTSEEIGRLSKGIQRARVYSDNIVDTVRESLLILDKDLNVLSANRAFYKMFNTLSDKTVGKSIFELDGKKWEIPQLRELLERIIPEQNVFEDYEIEYNFANTGKKKLLLNARQMFQDEKETKLILLAIQFQNID